MLKLTYVRRIFFFFLFISIPAGLVAASCSTRPTLQLHSGYSSYGKSHLRRAVKVCQDLLNKKGGYKLKVDGYFGPSTDETVRSWQGRNDLKRDGIVGSKTWASLCASSRPSSSLNNPYSTASRGTAGRWNPICKFVVDQLYAKYPGKFSCSTYRSSSSKSDHPGNAADCFPGRAGKAASGQDLRDGSSAAAWLRENAVALKVRYVIWQNKIWNTRRASEGWRYQGRSGVTQGHYDHIHISVKSDIN